MQVRWKNASVPLIVLLIVSVFVLHKSDILDVSIVTRQLQKGGGKGGGGKGGWTKSPTISPAPSSEGGDDGKGGGGKGGGGKGGWCKTCKTPFPSQAP